MKKTFGFFAIIWAITLALFNAVVFLIPHFTEYGGAFWVGYIFITIAFIGQLACAFFAFRAKNNQNLFYNIPLITLSYGGLVAMFASGTLCMKIPFLPEWLGIIICLITLATNIIAIIKAVFAASIVSGIDTKVKEQTYFMKNLTIDALHLYSTCNNDQLKDVTKKVYEAVRYSDPMSSDAISDEENAIKISFQDFKDAVNANDVANAESLADKVLADIKLRNEKCKLLK